MNRFNNIIYPNLIINAQYQQMRVTIPLSVDRTIVRIHCFRLKGAPDEMFHRAVRFLTTLGSPASMIFSDDVEMLERCQQRPCDRDRTLDRFLARPRQRRRGPGRQHLRRGERDADARAVPGLGELHDRRGGLMLPYEIAARDRAVRPEGGAAARRRRSSRRGSISTRRRASTGCRASPTRPIRSMSRRSSTRTTRILSIRVQRLLEARALVLTPMPRTIHLVSNIEVLNESRNAANSTSAPRSSASSTRATAAHLLRPAGPPARPAGRLVSYQTKARGLINCDGVHAPMTMPSSEPEAPWCRSRRNRPQRHPRSAPRLCFPSAAITARRLLDIAERAGIGVSSLYSYFPSKLHLLYAVFEPWQKEGIRGWKPRRARLRIRANGCARSCSAYGATFRWRISASPTA